MPGKSGKKKKAAAAAAAGGKAGKGGTDLSKERPVIESLLLKRGQTGKAAWKQQYVVLYPDCIRYFKKKGDAAARGSMNITADHYVSDIKSTSETQKNTFVVSDFLSTFYLSADSTELRDFWMHAIARIIRNLQQKEDWYGESGVNRERTKSEKEADYIARLQAYKQSQGLQVDDEATVEDEDMIIAQMYADQAREAEEEARRKEDDAISRNEDQRMEGLEKMRLEAEARLQAAEKAEERAMQAAEDAKRQAARAQQDGRAGELRKRQEQLEKEKRTQEERRRQQQDQQAQKQTSRAQEKERERQRKAGEAQVREQARQREQEQEREKEQEKRRRSRERKQEQKQEQEQEKRRLSRERRQRSAEQAREREEDAKAAKAAEASAAQSAAASAASAASSLLSRVARRVSQSRTSQPRTSQEAKPVAVAAAAPKAKAKAKAKGNIASRLNQWQQKIEEHQGEQSSNVFSGNHVAGPKIQKGQEGYGQAKAGSKTEERARAAAAWVDNEIDKLIAVIDKLGGGSREVTFGKLFDAYADISDSLVGILMRAKKRKRLTYEGDMLFQNVHDHVIIKLL